MLYTLRQQMTRESGRANTALADFIAPKDSGVAGYIGGFAVTAGIGEETVSARFAAAHDDYSKIMVKALADRLAEAFAEHLHARVRREFWGYAKDEALNARRAYRRGLSRHPAGARLSGAARSHRKGNAVQAARRGGGNWHRAYGKLCHDARALPSRASISRTRKAIISAWARSSATRWRTTPGARAGRSPKPSAGSRQSSTIPAVDCAWLRAAILQ